MSDWTEPQYQLQPHRDAHGGGDPDKAPSASPAPPCCLQVRGRKALVLEGDFASPLGLIVDAVTLKEHGVEM